jgi:hypothetical protein
MARPDPLQQITLLYHFTDRRNLPLIREMGGLYPRAKLAKKGVQVAAPGGNQWSLDADKLKGMDHYVHLCLRPNHPMEYLARQEGRIGDTIFLQIHPEVLFWEGVKFAPDVSNKAGVEVCSIEEARISSISRYSTLGRTGKSLRSRNGCSKRRSARFWYRNTSL